MTEQEIKKRNLKIFVFKEFPFQRIKEVCEALEKLNFSVEFTEEGRIICTDKNE